MKPRALAAPGLLLFTALAFADPVDVTKHNPLSLTDAVGGVSVWTARIEEGRADLNAGKPAAE